MSTTVFGRTHNPFTGDPEIWTHPTTGELADKVRDTLKDLAEKGESVEIESDGASMKTRPLRRTCHAAIKIAAELLSRGKITSQQAVASIPLNEFAKLLTSSIADVSQLSLLGTGLAAAPGAASGKLVHSAAAAVAAAAAGDKVILLVEKTTPDDMAALNVVSGVVATTGGFTSHSAVVARQMGKPCIVSYVSSTIAEADTVVTIDGSGGKLYAGLATFKEATIDNNTRAFLTAADQVAKLKVYANADTPEDVKKALDYGAQGIGLCRTEHTFFSEEGIIAIRRLILAKTEYAKQSALAKLQEVQLAHFIKLFTALGKLPAVVRLLDPPMHEFLPSLQDKEGITNVSKALKLKVGDIRTRIQELHEENPMLGHRGCRLSITFANLAEIQTYAIVAAARTVQYQSNAGPTSVGIMVPLLVDVREMTALLGEIRAGIKRAEGDVYVSKKQVYTIGAMLETPRACLQAYALAEHCEFFSFGTNDLTQMTWALSRDDSAKFMGDYVSRGLVNEDPFTSLDIDGVGMLMAHAVESLGDRRSKVKLGICGEHGGDPKSIDFCHGITLDYVSCSPFRILLARMAAAHAAIKDVEVPKFAMQEITIDPPIAVAVDKKVTISVQDPNVKDWIVPEQHLTLKQFFEKYDGWQVYYTNCPGGEPLATIKEFTDGAIGTLIGYKPKTTTTLLVSTKESGWLDSATFPSMYESKATQLNAVGKTFKWNAKLDDIKYVKPLTDVAPSVAKEVPQKSVDFAGIDLSAIKVDSNMKVGWTTFDVNKVPAESLFGWNVHLKHPVNNTETFAIVIGESKALGQHLIVAIDDVDAVQVPYNSILHIAPPGTSKASLVIVAPAPAPVIPAVKPVNEEVAKAISNFGSAVAKLVADGPVTSSNPTHTLDLKVLEKLSYEELAKELAHKYVYIKHPYAKTEKALWCKVIGWINNPHGVKAFTVETPPNDLSGKDGGQLKPWIKYFDDALDLNTLKQKQINIPFTYIKDVTPIPPTEWTVL